MSAAVNPFRDALEQYPILQKLGLSKITTPNPQDSRKLEFWPPGEPGDQEFPRPQELPADRPGVQILDPSVSSEDVAADVVSHYLVHQDPRLQGLYSQFSGTFQDPQRRPRLEEDYQWSQIHEGEKRPFEDWLQSTRVPDYLRGYLFHQWPEKSYSQMYSPEQRAILEQMRSVLQTKE
jgi:hypothetical protein